jgi:hypothetical protein
MVEFALILPLVVLLTFGIIEFAIAFNADSDINQAGRAGGRTAAILSTDPQMEYKAAAAAATALDLSPGQVDGQPKVCVGPYDAANPTGSGCLANPQAKVFSLVHPGTPGSPVWAIDAGQSPAGTWSPLAVDNWAVTSRQYGCPVNGQPGTFDKVVVYVEANHKLLVPGLFSVFFGNDSAPKFTSLAVFQLEPVSTSNCAP